MPVLGALVEELNDAGRLVLLVDGLDEVPTKRNRSERTGGSIRDELVSQLSPVRSVVVAGRPGAFEDAYPGLAMRSIFELGPLTDRQIGEFVREIPAAAAVLRSDSGVREIARTPLMLTMLCSAFDLAGASDLGGLTPNESRDVIMRAFIESRFAREAGENRVLDEELERGLGWLALGDAGGGGNRNLFNMREARRVMGEDALVLALDMHVLVPAGRDAVRFFTSHCGTISLSNRQCAPRRTLTTAPEIAQRGRCGRSRTLVLSLYWSAC